MACESRVHILCLFVLSFKIFYILHICNILINSLFLVSKIFMIIFCILPILYYFCFAILQKTLNISIMNLQDFDFSGKRVCYRGRVLLPSEIGFILDLLRPNRCWHVSYVYFSYDDLLSYLKLYLSIAKSH